ncbi:MAG: SdpI family protein [Caulobacteraceae bacterium]
MRLIKAMLPAAALIGLMAVFGLWAHFRLPDEPIATHFDAQWRPNGWMRRDMALAWPVGFSAGLLAVMTVLPFLVPPKGALERSAPAYGAVSAAVVGLIAVAQVGIVARALQWPVQTPQLITAALGLMFVVLGNFLSKVRYNLIMGIRTPWTLANEGMWDKTHRMAAPLFVMGGLFILIAGLLGPPRDTLAVIMIGTLVPALAAAVYSWWLWSRLPDDDKGRMDVLGK